MVLKGERFVIEVPGSEGEKFGLFPVSQRRRKEERQRDSGKGSFLGSRHHKRGKAGEEKPTRGFLLCDSKSRKFPRHSGVDAALGVRDWVPLTPLSAM